MLDSFNTFVPNATFLYSLKTSHENFPFSGGRERVHWERMGQSAKCILVQNLRKITIVHLGRLEINLLIKQRCQSLKIISTYCRLKFCFLVRRKIHWSINN